MNDALVLNRKTRSIGFYSLMLAAIAAALGALKLSVDPPVLKTAETEAAITNALNRGESYHGEVPATWAKALSLVLSGTAAAAGMGALKLSSSRPKSLSTPLLDSFADPATPDTPAAVNDDTYLNQGQLVADKIAQVFVDHPWLEEVVDIEGSLMDLLIIIGQPGKGKSCLASSIGLLRKLLHCCPTYIFDADADKNIRTGTWVDGHIAGLTAEEYGALAGDFGTLPYRQQHEQLLAQALTLLNSGQEPTVTLIFDELQRLNRNGFGSKDIQAFYDDYTAFRKRGDKVIWLWHEASKSGSGLHHLPKDSAYLTDLLNYAAVINFNEAPAPQRTYRGNGSSDRQRRSEKNSDRALFKPAGVPYGKEAMELITIPKLLFPQTLMQHLGQAAEYFDVRLSGYRDPGLAKRRAEVRRRINHRLKGTEADGTGTFRSSLEGLFSTPLAQHYLQHPPADIANDALQDGFTLEGMPSRTLFVELLQYLEDPNRQHWADGQGFYSLRRIMQSWGSKSRKGITRFTGTDALRAFLATYNEAHFGEWGNEQQTLWKPRYQAVDFD